MSRIALAAIIVAALGYGALKMQVSHRLIDVGSQPTVDAFENAKAANATTLVRDTTKSKVTLRLKDKSELDVAVSETIVRREAESDKIAMLAFHLPPMTLEDVLEVTDELRERLGLPEAKRERIEEWKAQANPDANNVERLILNGLDGQPTRSIVVLPSYNRARPWYIELQFNWDSSHPPAPLPAGQ